VEQETSRALNKETRQVLLAVLLVAAFMALAHFTPLKAWITNVQTWKSLVREFGWGAHAVFVGACALVVMLGVPRLPLCAAAGLIFGFGEGLGLSLIGSTLGSYGAFVLSRHGFRRAAESRAEKWPWLKKLLKKAFDPARVLGAAVDGAWPSVECAAGHDAREAQPVSSGHSPGVHAVECGIQSGGERSWVKAASLTHSCSCWRQWP
jgi:hypothetical protein